MKRFMLIAVIPLSTTILSCTGKDDDTGTATSDTETTDTTETDTDTETEEGTTTTSDTDTDTNWYTYGDTQLTDPEDWTICINEFMASNASTYPDEGGAFPDWIELYNHGSEDLSLDGATITDDLSAIDKHTLGDITIAAGGFVVLFADSDVDEGDLHLSFELDASGESLGLYTPDGAELDALNYDKQVQDVSAYRTEDCAGSWDYTTTPTPGESNQ